MRLPLDLTLTYDLAPMKNTTPDMNHKAAGIPKPIPNANTQQVKLMENVASK